MIFNGSPYQSYTYAYPHKTAYRPIMPPIPLTDAWADEDDSALFLYLHIPFCEMRCGFCNLFTTVHPTQTLESAYLDALERQARQVKAALGEAAFARLAIGGGTPTYLTVGELHRLFDIAERILEVDLSATPISVETSPLTATTERLRALRERDVKRISIGVQSFVEAEVRAAGRAQKTADVHTALERIRVADFPTLNIDLMYGLPGQTVASWLLSLETALRYQPEELYLYPLYVRPLTGLGTQDQSWDDVRLGCYRAGRDYLRSYGYQQVSMRLFRAAHAPEPTGPVYCCQEDGMVGLGCGARSYTRRLHYSSEYAVGRHGILDIVHEYLHRTPQAHDLITYGFQLDTDEQRRRYLLKSLLHAPGLSLAGYRAFFGTDALTDYPLLLEFAALGLADCTEEAMWLTKRGLEWSDALGPALYSAPVQARMNGFTLR
jgi:oxygen-independent coproporphyrinogen-3 oxidase